MKKATLAASASLLEAGRKIREPDMIGRLAGRVVAIAHDEMILDVGGVGWRLSACTRVLSRLGAGDSVVLHVETQMSEAAIRLYGFTSDEDRAWFARLQDAPGVGAKAALAILDVLDAAGLADAIALGDTAAISRAHGVGKKLAERVVAEFRGKPVPLGFYARLPADQSGGGAQSGQVPPGPKGEATVGASEGAAGRAEAVSALTHLGYGPAEAQRAVANAARTLGAGADTASLIRAGLKALNEKALNEKALGE